MNNIVLSAAMCFVFLAACSRSPEIVSTTENPESSIEPTPRATKPSIPVHIASFSSSELCDRLISIDTLPTREPEITDPIYESLIAKGEDAIPCLVEKITDTTPMPDPRYSVPHWQHFAVGDAAVFIMVDILRTEEIEREKLLIEMMPLESQKEWETNGIYAYFNYVSEPKNRKQLQRWWKNWLAKEGKEQ